MERDIIAIKYEIVGLSQELKEVKIILQDLLELLKEKKDEAK